MQASNYHSKNRTDYGVILDNGSRVLIFEVYGNKATAKKRTEECNEDNINPKTGKPISDMWFYVAKV